MDLLETEGVLALKKRRKKADYVTELHLLSFQGQRFCQSRFVFC